MMRLLSHETLLYTEMVAGNALAHERSDGLAGTYCDVKKGLILSDTLQQQAQKDVDAFGYDMTYLRRHLGQAQQEGACVLQLGGSDPETMSIACQSVMEATARGYCDYTALNLNCGCPSPKVAGKGCFGAALMEEADLVKKLVVAMDDGCDGSIPITVKCRIGTDAGYTFTKSGYEENISDDDEYSNLCRFIETVASSGIVTDFQVHARIAVLSKKFSPADNRKIPALKYHLVRRLVRDYPELSFSLNGGVTSLSTAEHEFDESSGLKGVMIGRAMAANPWSFAMADDILYKNKDGTGPDFALKKKPKNRFEVLTEFGAHADREEEIWDPVKIRRFIVKAVTPLFAGEKNGKRYRIALDKIAGVPKKLASQGKSLDGQPPLSELIMTAALENLSDEVLYSTPEESYEELISRELKAGVMSSNSNYQSNSQQIIQDWQKSRTAEQASTNN
jgi:tRNA-dihydrouridine synthase A